MFCPQNIEILQKDIYPFKIINYFLLDKIKISKNKNLFI